MKHVLIFALAVAAFTAITVSCSNDAENDFVLVTDVVPDAILEIR